MMSVKLLSTRPAPPDDEARLISARVKAVSGTTVLVEATHGLFSSARAFDCLTEPVVDDRVLVCLAGGEAHVLSVLERQSGDAMRISFPGDATLRSSGRIDVASGDGISISSVADVELRGRRVHAVGEELNIHVSGLLSTHAARIHTLAQSVRLISDGIDVVAGRVSQRVQNLMRWVEGVETLNVGNLIQTVRRNMFNHAEQVFVTAKNDVSIDGQRIHMG